MGRRRGECVGCYFCFVLEDPFEGGGEEPGWRENIGSALAFEEEGKPEGERRTVWWSEGWRWPLDLRLLVKVGVKKGGEI